MKVADIVVDIHNMRCSLCKVLVHDTFATECKICDAKFMGVQSNHIGLADKLRKERGEALTGDGDITEKYPDLGGGG